MVDSIDHTKICPCCGAALDACGTLQNDRAGGTSQRCGNPPAELFSEPFQAPEDGPDVLDIPGLATRLMSYGLRGDRESIEYLLSKTNYRTIRKYCRAIEKRSTSEELTANNVQTLILFDRALQGVMLQGIAQVELQFRAVLSRSMADNLGSFAHHHRKNFRNHDFYQDFLDDYSRELGYKLESRKIVNPEDFKLYGDVPVWQAVEILPLGTLSKLYRNIVNKTVRHDVADSFGVKYEKLVSWLRTICEIRNRCAHFEDVSVTPLTCKPSRIEGVKAPNDSAFYVCLVLDRLISAGAVCGETKAEQNHIVYFSENLIRLAELARPPVFLAAGFPLNWLKQLRTTSSHIREIATTEHDRFGNVKKRVI